MSDRNQHVAPRLQGGWAVRTTGATRANRLFDDRDAAVAFATAIAERDHSILFIHGRDGMVERMQRPAPKA